MNDCYTERAVNLYKHCRQQIKNTRSRQRQLRIGSVYFTLKCSINPSLEEVGRIFGLSKHIISRSIKAFRSICIDEPSLQWIFEIESGKTNVYRYSNYIGLDWYDVRRSLQITEDPDCDNDVIEYLARYIRKNNLTESTSHHILSRRLRERIFLSPPCLRHSNR